MKNYLRNKNFIPVSYIENIEKGKREGNEKGLIYLIIINLLIIPITAEGILRKEEKAEVPVAIEEEVYMESIINWINETDKDVIDLTVKDSEGIMIVKSLEKVYSLEEKGEIAIYNISQNEKGYYILEITRNNK